MKVAIVLGMHNTGTSLVAEGLHRAGCSMYRGKRNKNWEDPDVMRLNDDLMACTGADWRHPHPLYLHTADSEEIIPSYIRVVEHIEKRQKDAENQGYSFWGMKDPRLIWTWHYWQAALQETALWQGVHVIAIKRNINETAKSAAKRWPPDKISFWKQLAEQYNRRMTEIMEKIHNE